MAGKSEEILVITTYHQGEGEVPESLNSRSRDQLPDHQGFYTKIFIDIPINCKTQGIEWFEKQRTK